MERAEEESQGPTATAPMTLDHIILLVVGFLPAVVGLSAGRGSAWQFIALVCSCAALMFGLADAPIFGFILWILAWFFAAVAMNKRRDEMLVENLGDRLAQLGDTTVDEKALQRNIRKSRRGSV